VVISSRSEGIPNTLMEAWSVQKPVIATRVAGLPEAISDGTNGLLVSLEPADLAAAMLKIMEDREAAESLGLNGHSTLIERFTLDGMTDRIEQLFERVLVETGA
jgi:glycosyltransferase involved in cell wall biosynthesis